MRLAWFAVLAVMAGAPACAQFHPNLDVRENRTLDEVQAQRADDAHIAQAARPKPPTEADKKAIAWRADHLTCASKKGRTAAQFAAECKPAAANPS